MAGSLQGDVPCQHLNSVLAGAALQVCVEVPRVCAGSDRLHGRWVWSLPVSHLCPRARTCVNWNMC